MEHETEYYRKGVVLEIVIYFHISLLGSNINLQRNLNKKISALLYDSQVKLALPILIYLLAIVICDICLFFLFVPLRMVSIPT